MVGCRLVLPGPALDGASMYHMIEAYKVTSSSPQNKVYDDNTPAVMQHFVSGPAPMSLTCGSHCCASFAACVIAMASLRAAVLQSFALLACNQTLYMACTGWRIIVPHDRGIQVDQQQVVLLPSNITMQLLLEGNQHGVGDPTLNLDMHSSSAMPLAWQV
jgi:hypothetical protein